MNPWDYKDITQRIKPWVLDGYLTEYQRNAWAWSANRPGSFLWWACGSGKTLAGILWLLTGNKKEKKLIVTRAPAKQQWKFQVSQYCDLYPHVLHGYSPSVLSTEECVVISWEMLPSWWETIKEWGTYDNNSLAIVWDEIHRGKAWRRKEKYVRANGSTGWRYMDNRAAAAAQLSKVASRRLGLTATPIQDRRMDLWAQLDLIEPGKHGSSFNWAAKYCDAKPGAFGGLDTSGKSNCEELKEVLTNLAHVVSYQEMARSLPPKRRQLIYLDASEQCKPVGFTDALRKAHKQGAAQYFEVKLQAAAAVKRPWIVETVMDLVAGGQKVAILTGRRKDCEKLAEAVTKKLKKIINAKVWFGHGGYSLKHRQECVSSYAAYDGPGVFVGTTDAFGEAIDGLQHTDTVIFAHLPWTPGKVTQAEGRFSRHGSTRPVLISYVIAEGTVDERVADVLLEKLEIVEQTLDDSEAGGVAETLAGLGNEEEILDKLFEDY